MRGRLFTNEEPEATTSRNVSSKKPQIHKTRTIHMIMIFTGILSGHIYSADVSVLTILCNKYVKNGTNYTFLENSITRIPPSAEKWYFMCFYIGYSCCQLFCLMTLGKVRMKMSCGIGGLVAGVISFLYLFFAPEEIYGGMALRIVDGYSSGFIIILGIQCVQVWFPPEDYTRFFSLMHAGQLGIGIVYTCYIFIYKFIYSRGLFYTSAILGIIWSIIWLLFAANSPDKCKYISKEELKYIKDHTPKQRYNYKLIPWYSILKCPTLIAIVLCAIAKKLIYSLFMIYSPYYVYRYLKIEEFEYYCGPPFLLSFLVQFFTAQIRSRWFTTNAMRIKMFLTNSVPAALVFSFSLYDYNNIHLLLCFYGVIFVTSISYDLQVFVQIAPAFIIPLTGYLATVQMATPILSISIAEHYLHIEMTKKNWQNIFYWCGLTSFVASIPYYFFINLKIRKWNYYGSEEHYIYMDEKLDEVAFNIDFAENQLRSHSTSHTSVHSGSKLKPKAFPLEEQPTTPLPSRFNRSLKRSQYSEETLHKQTEEKNRKNVLK